MDLSSYVQRLQDDLMAAASLGDEDTRRAAALLATALQPAARLAMMTALSDFAAEITDALDDTSVDVRLDGSNLRVSVNHHDDTHGDSGNWPDASAGDTSSAHADETDNADSDDGLGRAVRDAGEELSRTTLRLVNNLKSQAEQAASSQGVSLNTYIQHAVSDAVRSAGARGRRYSGRGPHTMSGYAQG